MRFDLLIDNCSHNSRVVREIVRNDGVLTAVGRTCLGEPYTA